MRYLYISIYITCRVLISDQYLLNIFLLTQKGLETSNMNKLHGTLHRLTIVNQQSNPNDKLAK